MPVMKTAGSTRPTSAPASVREGNAANAAGATTAENSVAAPNQADSSSDVGGTCQAPTMRTTPVRNGFDAASAPIDVTGPWPG